MRLLLFNLATDADDPILGFTTRWICALAERIDFIHVITMRAGRVEMPENVRVYSVGKEKGYGEPRRAAEFYRLLLRVLQGNRIDVCFSHMIPIFTILAAPVLKMTGIPLVTWYAHPSLTSTLKLAHFVSDQMLASLPTAYPYKHDKLVVVGQGIDTDLFLPDGEQPEHPPIVLCVGRLSPVKDHPTLIEAAALLRQSRCNPFRVVIVGGPAGPRDDDYVRSLHEQVSTLGLKDVVHFEPAVAIDMLPRWYCRCSLLVNMTPTGSGDKVVWEAMACGRPCLVANEGFKDTLGEFADRFLFGYGNAQELAERLKWTLSLSDDRRRLIGNQLRQNVVQRHSLRRLSERLVNLFTQLNRKPAVSF